MPRIVNIHASAAETATTQSGTIELRNAEIGGVFILDVTAVAGTSPTLDLKLQFVDELSGKFVDIPGAAFAQKTGASTDSLVVFPGITAAANRAVSYVLSKTIRAVYTIGGSAGQSVTFSLSMQTLNGNQ